MDPCDACRQPADKGTPARHWAQHSGLLWPSVSDRVRSTTQAAMTPLSSNSALRSPGRHQSSPSCVRSPLPNAALPQNARMQVTTISAPAFLGNAAPLAAPAARRQAAAAARPQRSAAAPATRAVLTFKEAASGVEFPLVQKLWLGDEMRCVGGGCRSKKVGRHDCSSGGGRAAAEQALLFSIPDGLEGTCQPLGRTETKPHCCARGTDDFHRARGPPLPAFLSPLSQHLSALNRNPGLRAVLCRALHPRRSPSSASRSTLWCCTLRRRRWLASWACATGKPPRLRAAPRPGPACRNACPGLGALRRRGARWHGSWQKARNPCIGHASGLSSCIGLVIMHRACHHARCSAVRSTHPAAAGRRGAPAPLRSTTHAPC